MKVEDVQRAARQIGTLDAAGQDAKQLRIHLMWSVLQFIATSGPSGDYALDLAAAAIIGMQGHPNPLQS